MATPYFTADAGDTGPPLTYTLLTSGGLPMDLTGYTVTLDLRTSTGIQVGGGPATVTNAVMGMVSYQWVPNDLSMPGDLTAYWVVSKSGTVENLPPAGILIRVLGKSTFQCFVGPNLENVVPYVRNRIEDVAGIDVTDDALASMISTVARDLSRFYPISVVVGDFNAQTSPLTTVSGQQRYQCNPGNGFSLPVRRITGVLYRASGGFSTASEIGYLSLLPFSPANTFLYTPSLMDAPTRRILRDSYLNEVEHYGIGKYGVARDASGYVIDLFPVPQTSGLPVFVRYDSTHTPTAVPGDTAGSVKVDTLPDEAVRHFSNLLLAEAIDELALRYFQTSDVRAGQIEMKTDTDLLDKYVTRIRDNTYLELGVGAGSILVTS